MGLRVSMPARHKICHSLIALSVVSVVSTQQNPASPLLQEDSDLAPFPSFSEEGLAPFRNESVPSIELNDDGAPSDSSSSSIISVSTSQAETTSKSISESVSETELESEDPSSTPTFLGSSTSPQIEISTQNPLSPSPPSSNNTVATTISSEESQRSQSSTRTSSLSSSVSASPSLSNETTSMTDSSRAVSTSKTFMSCSETYTFTADAFMFVTVTVTQTIGPNATATEQLPPAGTTIEPEPPERCLVGVKSDLESFDDPPGEPVMAPGRARMQVFTQTAMVRVPSPTKPVIDELEFDPVPEPVAARPSRQDVSGGDDSTSPNFGNIIQNLQNLSPGTSSDFSGSRPGGSAPRVGGGSGDGASAASNPANAIEALRNLSPALSSDFSGSLGGSAPPVGGGSGDSDSAASNPGNAIEALRGLNRGTNSGSGESRAGDSDSQRGGVGGSTSSDQGQSFPPGGPAQPGLSGQSGQSDEADQPGNQGNAIAIGPESVFIGTRAFPRPDPTDSPNVVTVDGESFVLGPTEVTGPSGSLSLSDIGSSTVNGDRSQDAGGVGDGGDDDGDIALQTVVVGGVPVDIRGSSEAVIADQTFDIGPGAPETAFVTGSRTFSLGPEGVEFVSTSVVEATDPDVTGPVTANVAGIPIRVDGSEAVVDGTTFDIGSAATPRTIVAEEGGQTISIGPDGVGVVTNSVLDSGAASPLTTTVEGVPLTVSRSQVVISGSTFDIGPTARPMTITADNEVISIGPDGIGFDSTTLNPAFATAGGVTVSVGATEAIISSTTFEIGPGATSTTVVIDGETISLGPGGVGLASTTIPPATETGSEFESDDDDDDDDDDGDDDDELISNAVSLRSPSLFSSPLSALTRSTIVLKSGAACLAAGLVGFALL